MEPSSTAYVRFSTRNLSTIEDIIDANLTEQVALLELQQVVGKINTELRLAIHRVMCGYVHTIGHVLLCMIPYGNLCSLV